MSWALLLLMQEQTEQQKWNSPTNCPIMIYVLHSLTPPISSRLIYSCLWRVCTSKIHEFSTQLLCIRAPDPGILDRARKRITVRPCGCQFSLHFISSGNGRNFLYCWWIGWDMHIPKYIINESLQTKCDVAMWLIFSGILMGLAIDFF